jgi:hypothetical protein
MMNLSLRDLNEVPRELLRIKKEVDPSLRWRLSREAERGPAVLF